MLRQILIRTLIYEQDWIIYEQDWIRVLHKISDMMAIHILVICHKCTNLSYQ